MQDTLRARDITSRAARLGLAAVAALYLVVAFASLRGKTATYDETAHIAAGYSYWLKSDYRLNPEHPPLVKYLAAVPLGFLDLNLRFEEDWLHARQWTLGRKFLFEDNHAEPILIAARAPMIALGLWLGLAVYAATRRYCNSRRAALLAATLVLFEPNILAHSRLVAFDVPIALFIFLAADLTLQCVRRVRPRTVIALGLACSAAVLTKLTALPALAILFALGLAAAAMSRSPTRLGAGTRRVSSAPGRLALMLGVGVVVIAIVFGGIWAGYGFAHDQFTGPVQYAWTWNDMTIGRLGPVRGIVAAMQDARVLPDAYFAVFGPIFQTSHRAAWHWGQYTETGSYLYFFTTMLVKTPVALLMLMLIGIGSVFTGGAGATRDAATEAGATGTSAAQGGLARGKARLERSAMRFFLIFAAALFALASASRFNIGHRHLLGIVPLLIVPAAAAWNRLWLRTTESPATEPPTGREGSGGGRPVRVVLALLLVGCIVPALISFPRYIGYTNALTPALERVIGGRPILLESNADWGQDLPAVARYIERNDLGEIQLAYFGTALPEYYGIRARPLLCDMDWAPQIATENFDPAMTTIVSTALMPFLPSAYPAITQMRPVDRIGNSYIVFR